MSLKELGNLGNFFTPPLFFWWIGTENRVLFDPKKVDFEAPRVQNKIQILHILGWNEPLSFSNIDIINFVWSWWNFQRHFWWVFTPIWHHLQVHQECPCPPRHQEETWRTGGVLTWFLMSDLDKTFTDTSDGCSLPSDTISRSIRNVYVLLDSRKRLGGQVQSSHGSWCQIMVKLSQTLLMDVLSHLTPSLCPSGMSMYSRDLEDRWSLGSWCQILMNLSKIFWWMFPPIWYHLQFHQECPSPPKL